MYATVINPDANKRSKTPKYSEWGKVDNNHYNETRGYPNYDYPHHKGENYSTIIFHYHFQELTPQEGGYQSVDNFKEQITQATEDFKDMDFQLVTFNVPENDKFKDAVTEAGFECLGSSPGNHHTPIHLYVKTKKAVKKGK